jgi:hypothetical protein
MKTYLLLYCITTLLLCQDDTKVFVIITIHLIKHLLKSTSNIILERLVSSYIGIRICESGFEYINSDKTHQKF